jgi:outer membrane protein assembly factor BamB
MKRYAILLSSYMFCHLCMSAEPQFTQGSELPRPATSLGAVADGVYALFESGDLRALSHDGDLRWEVSLFDEDQRKFENSHGYGASPTQTADSVVIVVDHRGPSYVAAICKATWVEQWRKERRPRGSWTSPRIARIGGSEQVIISSGGAVDGYDATDGKLLWSHAGISGNQIASVTIQGDRLFVGADIGNREKDEVSVRASNCCLRVLPDSPQGYEVM